jgi:hypothetical protein
MYVLTVHFDGTVGLAVKFERFLGLDCPGLLQVNTLGVVEGFQAALSWLANLLSKQIRYTQAAARHFRNYCQKQQNINYI